MRHEVGVFLIFTIVTTIIIQSTPATAQIMGQYFVGTWVNTGAIGPYQENSGAFGEAVIAYSNGGYWLQLWARNGAEAGSNWLTIQSESEATTSINYPQLGAYGSFVLLLSNANLLTIHMAYYCTDKRLCRSEFSEQDTMMRK